jgi:hypothetical protein
MNRIARKTSSVHPRTQGKTYGFGKSSEIIPAHPHTQGKNPDEAEGLGLRRSPPLHAGGKLTPEIGDPLFPCNGFPAVFPPNSQGCLRSRRVWDSCLSKKDCPLPASLKNAEAASGANIFLHRRFIRPCDSGPKHKITAFRQIARPRPRFHLQPSTTPSVRDCAPRWFPVHGLIRTNGKSTYAPR